MGQFAGLWCRLSREARVLPAIRATRLDGEERQLPYRKGRNEGPQAGRQSKAQRHAHASDTTSQAPLLALVGLQNMYSVSR